MIGAQDQLPGRADLVAALSRQAGRRSLLVIASLLALLAAAIISTGSGVASLSFGDTAISLLSPILPAAWSSNIAAVDKAILLQLRLPRTVMAMIAGAGLSLAGVGLQGITRNPLVSSYTLGISSAAAFGASLAIVLGVGAGGSAGPAWIVGGAFTAAMICAAAVLGVSAMRGVTPIMLILGGVGLNYLFDALTANVQFLASDTQLASVVHWTFGSLNGATWSQASIAGSALFLVLIVLQKHAWALNAFSAGGDEVTASLGFSVGRTRVVVTIASVLVTAVIVSFTGKIGFVGLVAPHIARMLIGPDHRLLLPFGALIGAILLLIADLIGRLAFAPVIIPVGIVVAYLGVPIFIHLLLTRRQDFA